MVFVLKEAPSSSRDEFSTISDFLPVFRTKVYTSCLVPGDKRGAKPKNVAILADSLPLNASRHNTMFLKNWQHLLCAEMDSLNGAVLLLFFRLVRRE